MNDPLCRSCNSPLTHTLVDLGKTPLANSYITAGEVGLQDPAYPLHARVCGKCFLVQVDDVVPPEAIFRDYAYFSSYSEGWVAHAKRYADDATARLNLDGGSLVAEVASNDGYLLQHFVAEGIPVLGIDPALDAAQAARKRGVRTETEFFGQETAAALRDTYGTANLIAANNVLAHVPDINDFVAGFSELLAEDGVATFEFPHLLNLLTYVQFDTIYHEHFSYLSLHAVEVCFERAGLRVFDVEEIPTHGGSLRVWACRIGNPRKEAQGVSVVRKKENAYGMASMETYEGFPEKVAEIRSGLLGFLAAAKAEGKSVAAYGAAAKGNTLLNFCQVTSEDIDFVVDANPMKQGTLLPGSHIPVQAPKTIEEAKPDYLLILPWNLQEEITRQTVYINQWGGRHVVAIPSLTILS
ncbi:MAG: methyltransferase domain-containing protein [Candidatus Phaeomarinobacter sp.]